MSRKRAASKAIRADKKRKLRNKSTISEIKTVLKDVKSVIDSKDKEKIASSLKKAISKIDKAKNKGILHRKTASRWISRLSKKATNL